MTAEADIEVRLVPTVALGLSAATTVLVFCF